MFQINIHGDALAFVGLIKLGLIQPYTTNFCGFSCRCVFKATPCADRSRADATRYYSADSLCDRAAIDSITKVLICISVILWNAFITKQTLQVIAECIDTKSIFSGESEERYVF